MKSVGRKAEVVKSLREKRRAIKTFMDMFNKWESGYCDTLIQHSDRLGCKDMARWSSDEQNIAYLQLKLQLLVLFSGLMELGVDRMVTNHLIDDIERALRCDWCESVDACYKVGWNTTPFWDVNSEPGRFVFNPDFRCEDMDEDYEDLVRESAIGVVLSENIPYTEDELRVFLTYNSDFSDMIQMEELYYEESATQIYVVYSKLLHSFESYMDGLSVVEKRQFLSQKLVKEICDLKSGISLFAPGSDVERSVCIAPGLYLYLIHDMVDGYSIDAHYTQLNANFTAGLNANVLDLLIFELNEGYGFLPKKYSECMENIFPHFREEVEQRATKVAV